ncbi:MAG TPA: hypothetical protein VF105_15465 [Gemmatimonadaceae bacterium]
MGQALIQLGDAVECISDFGEERIFGQRKTDLEITVSQVSHGIEQSAQIDFANFPVPRQQIYFALGTAPLRAGIIAVTVPVSFCASTFAAVAPVAGLSAGRRGAGRARCGLFFRTFLFQLDSVAYLHDNTP